MFSRFVATLISTCIEEVVKNDFSAEESPFNENICHDDLMIITSITSIRTENFADYYSK